MNSPSFYTCIMSKSRIKYHALLIVTLRKMKVFGNMTVRATNAYTIYLSGIKIFSDSKGITDNILIWYINLKLIMIYFKCVYKVFEKYCMSFRLNKGELFKDRVEYVGHNLNPTSNVPSKSRFNMIHDWKLPTSSQGLYSSICLINSYHNYVPYFEVRIKHLQKLYRDYFC